MRMDVCVQARERVGLWHKSFVTKRRVCMCARTHAIHFITVFLGVAVHFGVALMGLYGRIGEVWGAALQSYPSPRQLLPPEAHPPEGDMNRSLSRLAAGTRSWRCLAPGEAVRRCTIAAIVKCAQCACVPMYGVW